MYYVYVVQNPQGILYKGYTSKLELRIQEHNSEISDSYTTGRGPWKLVYYEIVSSKKEAANREKCFKSGQGRQFLKTKVKRD